MSGSPEELVVLPKRTAIMWAAGVTVGYLVASVLILTFYPPSRVARWEYTVIAYGGIPCFTLVLGFLIQQLISPRPLLVVNRQGIIEYNTTWRGALIRWEDIGQVFAYKRFGQRFLGIMPTDLDALLSRRGWMGRLGVRMNRWVFRAPICVPVTAMSTPIDKLLAEINRYRRA